MQRFDAVQAYFGRILYLVFISSLNILGAKANEYALLDIPLTMFIVYATIYLVGLYLSLLKGSCILGRIFSGGRRKQ